MFKPKKKEVAPVVEQVETEDYQDEPVEQEEIPEPEPALTLNRPRGRPPIAKTPTQPQQLPKSNNYGAQETQAIKRDVVSEVQEEEEESVPTWVIEAVPTEHQRVITNTRDGKQYDIMTALVTILNTLEEFKE